jgi:hypothetical protein
MDAVSNNDRVGSKENLKQWELEITKITLQLADDLRSICVQKWVCGACSVTI